MDPVIVAAAIGAVGTIMGGLVGAYAARSRSRPAAGSSPPVHDASTAPVGGGESEAPTPGLREPYLWSGVSRLLRHPLFILLVGISLTGLGNVVWRARDAVQANADARLALAGTMEPWITRYTELLVSNANPGVAYGTPEGVMAALSTVRGALVDFSSTATTRGTELARRFGPEAVSAYVNVRAATTRLEQCLQLLLWRMQTYPNEGAHSAERGQVRDECTAALSEIDAQRSILIGEMFEQLSGQARPSAEAKALLTTLAAASEWVGADITVNGVSDTVRVDGRESFTHAWSALDGTACQIRSPTGTSGVDRHGHGAPIKPGHPWYPSTTKPTILTLECTNGWAVGVDSVVVLR